MDTVMQLGIYRATARAFGNSFIYIFFCTVLPVRGNDV
jgi:hypothetical protein